MVQMTFRELWDKWASDKRIWIRAVQITRSDELGDGDVSEANYGSEKRSKDMLMVKREKEGTEEGSTRRIRIDGFLRRKNGLKNVLEIS